MSTGEQSLSGPSSSLSNQGRDTHTASATVAGTSSSLPEGSNATGDSLVTVFPVSGRGLCVELDSIGDIIDRGWQALFLSRVPDDATDLSKNLVEGLDGPNNREGERGIGGQMEVGKLQGISTKQEQGSTGPGKASR